MDWKPIETMPEEMRDGRRVMLYNPMAGGYTSEYRDGHWPLYLWAGSVGHWYPVPTHYAVITPPETEE